MLPLLAAIASFIVMGVVNFAGPLLTRRTPVLTVVAIGQGTGSMVLVLILLVSLPSVPGIDFFAVGIAIGVLAGMATSAAFRAGQLGNIGLVSVILALSAVIPAIGGIAEGEQLPLHQWLGIALAAVGTVLTLLWGQGGLGGDTETAVSVPVGAAAASQPPHPALKAMQRASRNWPLLALIAATAFGIFMLLFSKLSEEDILWAGAVTRTSMASASLGVMLLLHQPMFAPGNRRRQIIPLPFLGLLMVSAVMLYGYASTHMLTVASALTAFAPVVTVSLSWIVLRERLTPIQIFGIALTIVGLVLLSV